MKVKELIEKLKKYDEQTEVCSGFMQNRCMHHLDLIIKESHPIGDRDSEDELLLWIGCNDSKDDTAEQHQQLFSFFMWFRENGEKYMDKSIQSMLDIYLEGK